jgi:phosphopantothenoylcysteine decarboxylase/phosphopantothenate--cysteine ligase
MAHSRFGGGVPQRSPDRHAGYRLECRFADDLVTTLCLATTAPITVCPAMNHRMWQHPATQANMATLRERGVQVVGPEDGPLAEGESGPGRLSEPETIIAALAGVAR